MNTKSALFSVTLLTMTSALLSPVLFSSALAVEPTASGAPQQDGFFGAADTNGGYGGLVLQKVLPHWQPPQGVNGMARILVRITSQGRVMSCQPQRDPLTVPPVAKSDIEAIPGTSATVTALAPPPAEVAPQDRQLAEAACRAVAAAGDFEIPPYGMVAEVSLFLSAGNVRSALAAQPADYASLVLSRVQPFIVVPPRLGGEFKVGVTVSVRGDGALAGIRVHQPSGRNDVDAAVVQAFSRPGVIPPPPGGTPRDLQLTYTLRNE